MHARTPPSDYGRASELMDQRRIDVILACSRANVGYVSDHVYHTAQGLPFLLEDAASGVSRLSAYHATRPWAHS